jgi:mono/diheme cytochrome c family protein
MRAAGRLIVATLAALGLAALVIAVALVRGGIGARTAAPGPLETAVARRARHALIPREARARANPEPENAENERLAETHWADHCASCHGADGRGDTPMGRGLWPRPPDMRLAPTQALSDGELFYIIEEGVRLTGMPGWSDGTAEGMQASWHLVQFIRRLPRLTDEEAAAIAARMPLSPADWRAREEERKYLSGELSLPPPAAPVPGDPR